MEEKEKEAKSHVIVELPERSKKQDPLKDKKGKNIKVGKKHFDVPDTNLLLACLVTLCFNPVLGVCAAYFSISAAGSYRDGEAKKGEKKAFISVVISLTAIVFTVVLVMSVVLWLAMKGIRVKV